MSQSPPGSVDRQRYERVKVIGKGRDSIVWLVKDTEDRAPRAVREVKNGDENSIKNTKEVLMLLQITGCNSVTQCHGWYETEDVTGFVYTFCQGGEATTRWRDTATMSEQSVRYYTAQVVLGLDFLHRNHLVYRDLRPETILLTRQGNVQLADLHLAQRSRSTSLSVCPGRPEYMAPEVIGGSSNFTYSADWWSLGVVLFEFLEGYPPFYSSDKAGVLAQINAGSLSFPPSFSSAAKDLITGLLVTDPQKRLGSHKRGVDDIKKHKFYTTTDWEALGCNQLTPPSVHLFTDEYDTVFFDDFSNFGG